MNTELFIVKRILKNKNKGSISRPIVRIAIGGIALGIIVMIISVSIVTGFKIKIREKVIGFSSHIVISNFDSNISFEPKPIERKQSFLPALQLIPGIKHVQVFATKAGIIKTKDNIQGVVIKGVGSDFDWSFFENNIVDGKKFSVKDTAKSNEIMISKFNASKLKLKVGDNVVFHFIQNPPRMRKFKISGIYETGFEEFDKTFVLADIAHVQKLNDWNSGQIGGFEVSIINFDELERMGIEVNDIVGYHLNSRTIKELYPQIFGWLQMQDMNAEIIIGLMILVAAINMISALLILILERTTMIGILKALGAKNWAIRKIFIYNAIYLIGKGLLWGNIIGISLCFLQLKFKLIDLPQESYYMPFVPINIDFLYIFLLNIGTLIICSIMLIVPSYIISKINPVKAIKID